ncbi:MAG: hypothetical protein P1U84_17485 [Parvibaculaceae bacterium]|nr:hypothetical protein [Parvibaculaceae bacterium]
MINRKVIPAGLFIAAMGLSVSSFFAFGPALAENAQRTERHANACAQSAEIVAIWYKRATSPIPGLRASDNLQRLLVELEMFQAMQCPPELLSGIHER